MSGFPPSENPSWPFLKTLFTTVEVSLSSLSSWLIHSHVFFFFAEWMKEDLTDYNAITWRRRSSRCFESCYYQLMGKINDIYQELHVLLNLLFHGLLYSFDWFCWNNYISIRLQWFDPNAIFELLNCNFKSAKIVLVCKIE